LGSSYSARVHAGGNGSCPVAVDFDRDRALQQGYRDDETIDFIGIDDRALQTGKGTGRDVYAGSHIEPGPWLGSKSRAENGFNGLDFRLVNRERSFAGADNADDAGSGEDGNEAILGVEAAEQIAGEQGDFDRLDAVGPATAGGVYRKEFFVSLMA
jgi:hypothetical protein